MLCLDIFQVGLKGNRVLNLGHPSRFNMKRRWFSVLPVKNIYESHPPCELFKVSQKLLLNSCFVCRRNWNELETL